MSTESFLILHGIGNHRLPEHWQFWIAGRMRDRGHQVLYPGLPEPDTPSYLEWASALDDNLAAMEGDRRTVIAHSLACLLWMRRADGLDPRRRVNRLLLVSPPANEQVPSPGAEFLVEAINADAVRASASDEIRIVCSDNDPYNPAGASQLYAGPRAARSTHSPEWAISPRMKGTVAGPRSRHGAAAQHGNCGPTEAAEPGHCGRDPQIPLRAAQWEP